MVLAQFALRDAGVVFKVVGGVEVVVAEELPGRAMNAVGARLDGRVQTAPADRPSSALKSAVCTLNS